MAACVNIYRVALLVFLSCVECHQPNIVFIVSDDLGKMFTIAMWCQLMSATSTSQQWIFFRINRC